MTSKWDPTLPIDPPAHWDDTPRLEESSSSSLQADLADLQRFYRDWRRHRIPQELMSQGCPPQDSAYHLWKRNSR